MDDDMRVHCHFVEGDLRRRFMSTVRVSANERSRSASWAVKSVSRHVLVLWVTSQVAGKKSYSCQQTHVIFGSNVRTIPATSAQADMGSLGHQKQACNCSALVKSTRQVSVGPQII